MRRCGRGPRSDGLLGIGLARRLLEQIVGGRRECHAGDYDRSKQLLLWDGVAVLLLLLLLLLLLMLRVCSVVIVVHRFILALRVLLLLEEFASLLLFQN